MVFNSDNSGVIYSNINLSIAPSFITASGSLGSFFEFSNVNVFVQANADSAITYSLTSGALPSNVNLNSNGTITGTTPSVASNTNYSFSVTATDAETQTASRSFSLSVSPDVVTWVTPSPNIFIYGLLNIASDNVLLSATSLVSSAINYSAANLPAGLSVISSNITGTPTLIGTSNTTLTATSALTSKKANIGLTFKVVEPYVLANYSTLFANIGIFANATFAPAFASMHFDDLGANLYLLNDGTTNVVYQYSLASNWDVTTPSLVGALDFIEETAPAGLYVRGNGTKMYIVGTTADKVIEFTLTTPWLVSSAVRVGEFSISAQEINSSGIHFSTDGTKMFVVGRAGDDVNVYNLSTAWQANTASFVGVFTPASAISDPTDIRFNNDGTRMYLVSATTDLLYQFNISPAWDILASSNVATSTYNLVSPKPAVNLDSAQGLEISRDGTRIYILQGGVDDTVVQFTLNTPNEISSIRPSSWNFFQASVTGETTLGEFFIRDDGLKLYTTGAITDKVEEYNLTTAWDIGSATFVGNSLVLSSIESTPGALFFKPDGTKMYIGGTGSNRINEFDLSPAWQANSAVFVGNITIQSPLGPTATYFKSTGDKFYVTGSGTTDKILEYYMSTPWQVNTAILHGELTISSVEATPTALTFSEDGTIMFFGGAGDIIYRYNLSTAWSANTATSNANLNLSSTVGSITGLQFGRKGLYLFFSGAETAAKPTISSGIYSYFVS